MIIEWTFAFLIVLILILNNVCLADDAAADSLAGSPAGAPVATGPPAAPDAVHGGDVGRMLVEDTHAQLRNL